MSFQSSQQPLCHYCGKPIPKYTEHHSVDTGTGGVITSFTTWDGESYKDEFFCGGPCVDRFAYFMARAGRCTNLYNEAIAKRRDSRISLA